MNTTHREIWRHTEKLRAGERAKWHTVLLKVRATVSRTDPAEQNALISQQNITKLGQGRSTLLFVLKNL